MNQWRCDERLQQRGSDDLDWEMQKGFSEELTFKLRPEGWLGEHVEQVQEKAQELNYDSYEIETVMAPSSAKNNTTKTVAKWAWGQV